MNYTFFRELHLNRCKAFRIKGKLLLWTFTKEEKMAQENAKKSDDEATAAAGGYFHYLGFTRLPKRDVFI